MHTGLESVLHANVLIIFLRIKATMIEHRVIIRQHSKIIFSQWDVR